MSNDVRGYINYSGEKKLTSWITSIEQKYNIGIKEIKPDELYHIPLSILSESDEKRFYFIIGDDNQYYNASFLIDYIDYAPEADIGFPIMAKQRLNILLDAISEMIKVTNASKMVIALTDSCEIETIKKISLTDMRAIIHADFAIYQAPPDTLYEIMC